jgi:homoserine O-acetyltransferase/O-succinyltransferase
VKAKALVIVAEHDHMVNPEPAKRFAKELGARTIVSETLCGHMAPGCDPSLAEAVRGFLDAPLGQVP